MANYSDEFPMLAVHGLYAADIKGDGNCLFNALSDQIYGNQNEHHKIRARVIEYMREHADYYKQFIDVKPGGGQRRNPKRKNAGVYATTASFIPPTQEEIDAVFEGHLGSMARGGTYGDNMEISAFTSAFKIDVKIYQSDFAYMVSAPNDGTIRPVAHIAYHTWEHYSSIRNINGPHTGLPKVSEMTLSPAGEAKSQETAEKAPHVAPWMINVVLASLPYLADRDAIKKALEESKGNIDTAVSALMDAEERASISSQPGSSSTERDPDSDDEEFYGPNKKQDRRMSRATKALRKQKAEGTNPEGVKIDGHESKASIPQSPSVELPVRPAKQAIPRLVFKQPKPEQVEKQEIPASDDDAELHLDVDETEDDAGSEYSSKSRSQSTAPELNPPKNNLKIVFKQQSQKPPPNQKKRVTARERIEQKKSAQKAARKESKRTVAASSRQLEVTSVNVSKTAPPHDLGMGIKTLYI